MTGAIRVNIRIREIMTDVQGVKKTKLTNTYF